MPEYINPNFDMLEINNYKHNTETGAFTSDIGNGKFVLTKDNKIKVVFKNFKYNNIPNLELYFNKKLTWEAKNPNPELKI